MKLCGCFSYDIAIVMCQDNVKKIEAESKAMRVYAQGGQYHTIMESRGSWYQSHALNLAMSIESSSIEQRNY